MIGDALAAVTDVVLVASDNFWKAFSTLATAALAAFYAFSWWCMIRNFIMGNP